MDLETENALICVLGGFLGLADDDEYLNGIPGLNPEDENQLENVIRQIMIPDFLHEQPDRRLCGLDALASFRHQPYRDRELHWNSLLPPFDYPRTINLHDLAYRIALEAHRLSV